MTALEPETAVPDESEQVFEHCIGNCYGLIEMDPDDPDPVPFCGSDSCRRYAQAEARADSYGLI